MDYSMIVSIIIAPSALIVLGLFMVVSILVLRRKNGIKNGAQSDVSIVEQKEVIRLFYGKIVQDEVMFSLPCKELLKTNIGDVVDRQIMIKEYRSQLVCSKMMIKAVDSLLSEYEVKSMVE